MTGDGAVTQSGDQPLLGDHRKVTESFQVERTTLGKPDFTRNITPSICSRTPGSPEKFGFLRLGRTRPASDLYEGPSPR